MTTILTLLEQIQIGNPKAIQNVLAAYLQTTHPNLDQSQYIEIPGFGKKEYLTPLMLAARMGQATTIVLLLQHGADINYIYFQDGHVSNTALIQGIESENIEIVSLLLKNGAEIHSEKQSPLSQNRVTCFHCALIPATRLKRIDILELLLSYGANINAPHNTITAFTASVQMWDPLQPSEENLGLTEFLLTRGAGSSPSDAHEIFYNPAHLPPHLYTIRQKYLYQLFETNQRLLPIVEFDNITNKKERKIIDKKRNKHKSMLAKYPKVIGFSLARHTPLGHSQDAKGIAAKIIAKFIFHSKEYRSVLTYEFDRAKKDLKLKSYSPDEASLGKRLKSLFRR